MRIYINQISTNSNETQDSSEFRIIQTHNNEYENEHLISAGKYNWLIFISGKNFGGNICVVQ